MLQSVAPIRRIAVLASVCGLATVSALALIGTARADDAREDGTEAPLSCSNATLKGTYAFANTGWSISTHGGAMTPFAHAGLGTFNGDGTNMSVITVVSNGVVVAKNVTGTGTYSIRADCTGTAIFNFTATGPLHFNIYVSPSGNDFRRIATDPGSVEAGTETRVAR